MFWRRKQQLEAKNVLAFAVSLVFFWQAVTCSCLEWGVEGILCLRSSQKLQAGKEPSAWREAREAVSTIALRDFLLPSGQVWSHIRCAGRWAPFSGLATGHRTGAMFFFLVLAISCRAFSPGGLEVQGQRGTKSCRHASLPM